MRSHYVGIDVGSQQVKVIVAAPAEKPDLPMAILGTGTAVCRGVRQGFIADTKETARAVREAVQRASAAAKVQVRSARLAIGGVGIEEMHSQGDITLTAAGGIVGPREIERALNESVKRASSKLANRTVLHPIIPLEFRVDGAKMLGRPEGMQGTKLAVDTLLITVLTQHYEDLIQAVEMAGVEVEDVMPAPLAASLVTLTRAQKTAGVCLADIGADTLSLIVFDGDVPVSLKVFSGGSNAVTNAIALSFQIPLSEAESVKRGGVTGSDIPHKKIASIVAGKLKESFTQVNTHLRTINRSRLLPAGIVIVGGGAGLSGAAESARQVLKLPAQVGQIGQLARSASIDSSWAVAYGLCRWGFGEDAASRGHTLGEVLSGGWDSLKQALRNLLP